MSPLAARDELEKTEAKTQEEVVEQLRKACAADEPMVAMLKAEAVLLLEVLDYRQAVIESMAASYEQSLDAFKQKAEGLIMQLRAERDACVQALESNGLEVPKVPKVPKQ
jgi:hypothetical protein